MVRPRVSPPGGKRCRFVIAKKKAAASSASPIPICTRRRGQEATTPAPSQAPATEAAIMPISVVMSTSTMAMKMKACTIVGSAWPTFNVPGIFSSGTRPFSLNIDVVGANEPMPSVSKKLVRNPMESCVVPGRGSPPDFRTERIHATR